MKDEILKLSQIEQRFTQRQSMAESTKDEIFKKAKIEAEEEGYKLTKKGELDALKIKEEAIQRANQRAEEILGEEQQKRQTLENAFERNKDKVRSLLIEEVFNLGNR